jgi:hypothetical protein
MMGMLVGVAALAAYGFHRFHALTRELDTPLPGTPDFEARFAAYRRALDRALHTEYGEIFLITAAVCLAACLVCLALRTQGDGQPG